MAASIARSKPLSFERVGLTVEQQCQIAEVSRAGFYRYLQQTAPEQADLLLRARLQELAVEHHRLHGYRLLTETLRREGQVVNHKRVLRLMREDNLLSHRQIDKLTAQSNEDCMSRFQQGSLFKLKRKSVPDVWVFRWYEANLGKRTYKKQII